MTAIAAGFAGWLVLSVPLALLVGRCIAQRDTVVPAPWDEQDGVLLRTVSRPMSGLEPAGPGSLFGSLQQPAVPRPTTPR